MGYDPSKKSGFTFISQLCIGRLQGSRMALMQLAPHQLCCFTARDRKATKNHYYFLISSGHIMACISSLGGCRLPRASGYRGRCRSLPAEAQPFTAFTACAGVDRGSLRDGGHARPAHVRQNLLWLGNPGKSEIKCRNRQKKSLTPNRH